MSLRSLLMFLAVGLIAGILLFVLFYTPLWTLKQISQSTSLDSSIATATTFKDIHKVFSLRSSVRSTERTGSQVTLAPFIFHTTTTSTTLSVVDAYKGGVDFKYVKCNPFLKNETFNPCSVVNVSCCPASITTESKARIYPVIPPTRLNYSNGSVYYVSNTTKFYKKVNITTCMGGKVAAVNTALYGLYFECVLDNCSGLALTDCREYCTDARDYKAECIYGVCKLIPTGNV